MGELWLLIVSTAAAGEDITSTKERITASLTGSFANTGTPIALAKPISNEAVGPLGLFALHEHEAIGLTHGGDVARREHVATEIKHLFVSCLQLLKIFSIRSRQDHLTLRLFEDRRRPQVECGGCPARDDTRSGSHLDPAHV